MRKNFVLPGAEVLLTDAITKAILAAHTAKLKRMLRDAAAHAREDVRKVSDPAAQALFETTAEVLLDLEKACEGCEDSENGRGSAG